MDNIFLLEEEARANFLRTFSISLGCSYICVWSFFPQPSNCLIFVDGFYHEESTGPSSSSTTPGRIFFDEYRKLAINIENNVVPGLAFKNNFPYIELQESYLQTHASAQVQRQFYVAARIKSSIFLGSTHGEIELGFSNVLQVNTAIEIIKNLIPTKELPQPTDQNPHSSPSSSLKSLSMGSPESSSLIFNIPITSHLPEAFRDLATNSFPFDQRLFSTQNIPFPTTSSSPSPSSSSSSHQPPVDVTHIKGMAFKKYGTVLPPVNQMTRDNLRRQSLLKRSIIYFRYLNLTRINELMRPNRSTSTQLHHMISERKRREKLNESFLALRSLLPAGTKRDKTSMLASTREYLTSLKTQVDELSKKNKILEAQLLPTKEEITKSITSSHERFSIVISHVPESTSAGHLIDLQVIVRGESPMIDMIIRILEFLKRINNVSVLSVEANTQISDSTPIDVLTFRLSIQDDEWDESAFQEAVRRVVADLLM